jgi:hypothetical protein
MVRLLLWGVMAVLMVPALALSQQRDCPTLAKNNAR